MSVLPPLPWVVHAVGRNMQRTANTANTTVTGIFVGVFDSRMDLLRAMTRWIFEDDDEILVNFCLGLALNVKFANEELFADVWHFFTQFRDIRATDLITNSYGVENELPLHPFFKVSSIRDECVDVLAENNMLRASDLFRGLSFKLTPEQFNAVARWIRDETLWDHLRMLAWCGVVRKRDGFEGRVNARVASFLF